MLTVLITNDINFASVLWINGCQCFSVWIPNLLDSAAIHKSKNCGTCHCCTLQLMTSLTIQNRSEIPRWKFFWIIFV